MASQFNDTFVKSVFNDKQYSDVVLIFNGESYSLMTPFIKHYAPFLHAEFEKAPQPSLVDPSIDPALVPLITQLTALCTPKKILTISEPFVSKEVVQALLEHMYGKPFDATPANHLEVYVLSTRFGMEKFITQSKDLFKKAININTILDLTMKALDEKAPTIQLYLENLVENICFLPREKVLQATSKMSLEVIKELVKSDKLTCEEDFVLEIIENWGKTNDVSATKELMVNVKLEALSGVTVVTKLKNVQVDSQAYIKTLESIVLTMTPNVKLRYGTHSPVVLGKRKEKYPGYRLITLKEAVTEKFSKIFKTEYSKLNAIKSLDTFKPTVVCCQEVGLSLVERKYFIDGCRKDAFKNESFSFKINGDKPITDFPTYATNNFEGHEDGEANKFNAGLFVLDTLKFE